MRHRRFTHFFRRTAPARRAVAALAVCALPRAVHGQVAQPATQPAVPALAPYRAPVLALVQPVEGGTMPQDKPIVVFRFAQGEVNDPIDARSFSVTRDGIDVTAAFQLSNGDAWGSLDGASLSSAREVLSVGLHHIVARICSARGACGSVATDVNIAPAPASTSAMPALTDRRSRLVELLLRASRKLLLP